MGGNKNMKLTQQKLIEKEIEKSYYRLGKGVQIDIMDISKNLRGMPRNC